MIYNIDIYKLTGCVQYHHETYNDMNEFVERCGVAVLTLKCG